MVLKKENDVANRERKFDENPEWRRCESESIDANHFIAKPIYTCPMQPKVQTDQEATP